MELFGVFSTRVCSVGLMITAFVYGRGCNVKLLKNSNFIERDIFYLMRWLKKHYIFAWLAEKSTYIRGPIQDF